MKYAVIKTGGKQYQVFEGKTLEVERLKESPKEKVEFEEVLLAVDEGKVLLGQPKVVGGKVVAEVLEQIKGPKIRVAKFKAKARYRRVTGHRQSLSRIKIEKILTGEKKAENLKETQPVKKIADKTEVIKTKAKEKPRSKTQK